MASTKRSPATNELLQELRRRREALLALTPVRNQYTFEGTKYTKRGYDELVKQVEADIADVEKALRPTVFETTQAEVKAKREITQETQKLRLDYNSVQARRKDIEKAISSATTVQEETNLQNWLALFNENERRLQVALNEYEAGRRPQVVPEPIELVAVGTMKMSPPVGPTAPEVLAATTQPAGSVGQVRSTGPVSAAVRGEAGIGAPAPTPTGEVVSTPFGTYRRKPDGEFEPVYKDTSGQWKVGFGPTPTPAGQPPATDIMVPGGGAGEGTTGGTIPSIAPPAQQQLQVPVDWEQAAREAYGVWFDAIKNIPELKDFINRLMTGPELSEAQFMAQLQQTNWWRQTTAAARDFARRQVQDPATLQTEIDNKKAALRQIALSRGLPTSDEELSKVATDQIKFGWSDQVTVDYLGNRALGTTEGVANLRSGFYGQQIRETAAKFGVPLSDTTLNKWVADVATGQQNVASFEAYARDLAKNLFPALSNGFDRGLTFPEMTAPYAQFASQILEIPADTIDFTRPEWARAFTTQNEKGEQRQMSYGEWFDYLRSESKFGWEYTDQARSQAFSVANDLGRMFGRSA